MLVLISGLHLIHIKDHFFTFLVLVLVTNGNAVGFDTAAVTDMSDIYAVVCSGGSR